LKKEEPCWNTKRHGVLRLRRGKQENQKAHGTHKLLRKLSQDSQDTRRQQAGGRKSGSGKITGQTEKTSNKGKKRP